MAIALVLRAGGSFYDGLTPTIYAAPTSQGTGSGASEANATTFTGALSGATAGDIIGVLPGVYTGTPSGGASNPIFKTTNSGTSGNPIIVVGKYDHLYYYSNVALRCEIRSSAPVTPVDNTNRPGIGLVGGQSHIQWRNFFLDGTYVPPIDSHGMATLDFGTTGGRFRKCVFRMLDQVDGDDNRNAIFLGGCGTSQVDYCYFYDGSVTSGGGRHINNSGITLYPGNTGGFYPTVTIEHNTFRDCTTGIFVKGRSGTDNIQGSYGNVRYNAFYDLSYVGIGHQGEDPTAGMDFYQNLFVRCGGAAFLKETGLDNLVPELYERARIYSNTIIDCGGSGALGANSLKPYPAAGVNFYEWYNNIVKNSGTTVFMLDLNDPNYGGPNVLNASEVYSTLDYNWYYRSDGSARFRERSGTATGIAAWRTATGMEANSSESNPGFVNAAEDNYRLSSADTGSSTGGARGCYITGNETIGNGVN